MQAMWLLFLSHDHRWALLQLGRDQARLGVAPQNWSEPCRMSGAPQNVGGPPLKITGAPLRMRAVPHNLSGAPLKMSEASLRMS